MASDACANLSQGIVDVAGGAAVCSMGSISLEPYRQIVNLDGFEVLCDMTNDAGPHDKTMGVVAH